MKQRMKRLLRTTIVALAVLALPAAAQATTYPHVYRNGSEMGGGKTLRVIGWGTLDYHNETIGTIECHTLMAQQLENPSKYIEGPKGEPIQLQAEGQVEIWDTYECSDPACVTPTITNRMVGSPNAELIEPEPKVIREKIGLEVSLNCPGFLSGNFTGAVQPRILNNGVTIGIPGEIAMPGTEANGGALTSALGELAVQKNIKFEGYGAEELIEAKNP